MTHTHTMTHTAMNLEDTTRLLGEALDVIMGLEDLATSEQKKRIEALFNEIKYAPIIDDEMRADDIRDVAIRTTDALVREGLIADCIDTDNEAEFEVQDIIIEVLNQTHKHTL